MRLASATTRAGSTFWSTPRHHCTFQVMSFMARLSYTGAHERLDELLLEQQERDQQRRGVSSVAAVMIDQSSPWSVAENTCSPTVTGRDSTELVMMSGHRKLFQW